MKGRQTERQKAKERDQQAATLKWQIAIRQIFSQFYPLKNIFIPTFARTIKTHSIACQFYFQAWTDSEAAHHEYDIHPV